MKKVLAKSLEYIRPIDIMGVFMLAGVVSLYAIYDVPLRIQHWTAVYYVYGIVVAITFAVALFHQIAEKMMQKSFDFGYKELFGYAARRTLTYIKVMIPFIIFMTVYDSLHDVTAYVNSNYLDAVLIKIDQFILFGNDVAVLAYNIIPEQLFGWLLYAYNSYFLYFILTPLIFVVLKKDKEIEEVLSTVILGCYIGVIGYFLVPCYGPVIAQRELFPFDFARGPLIDKYAEFKFFYHCFPSLHVAVTAIWLHYARKHVKWLFYLYLPLVVSLWVATMYLRWHYLIDVLVGFMIAGIAIKYGPRMNQRIKKREVVY